jgi:hypothetical protein
MKTPWDEYQNDFDAMSDAEVDRESRDAQALVDENESWLEAVAAWDAAGRPRTEGADQ